MEKVGEMVLQKNPNPLTKAAFVEIVRYLIQKDAKVDNLRKITLAVCIKEIRTRQTAPVGWQMYLEQAATILLGARNVCSDEMGISTEEVMVFLLQNENEEVVLKAVSWIVDQKSTAELAPAVRSTLRELVVQDKWDGVRAMALQAISSVMADEEDGISLEECIHGYGTGGVMPLKEGWITVYGYAARKVSLIYH
jgi:hypothetical protein